MAVTREELAEAGASPALSRLLAREMRDWTRHPMVVAAFVIFAGFLGWLVIRDGILQDRIADVQAGQVRLEAKVDVLDEKADRLEAKVDGTAAEQAEIKAGVAEIRAILASRLPPEK